MLAWGGVVVLWLLDFVHAALEFVVGLLPSISVPDLEAMVSTIAPVWEALGWANQYFPVDSIGVMLGILVGTFVVMGSIDVLNWILTKLHVLGGDS